MRKKPPNSRLSRLRLADWIVCDRSIDVDGDSDTADARARVAVSIDRRARELLRGVGTHREIGLDVLCGP